MFTEFFNALNATVAVSSSPSKRGSSYYANAATCGMKARLGDLTAGEPHVFPQQVTDAKGKTKVVGPWAGTAFHGLRELQTHPPAVAIPTFDELKDIDLSVAEAVRTWQRERGSEPTLGEIRACEVVLADDGGRVDAVVDIRPEHADAFEQYGLFGVEPGIYLWDYKLLKAVKTDDVGKYSRSLQGKFYCRNYDRGIGATPKGIIYDLTSRAIKPTIARLLVLCRYTAEDNAVVDEHVADATQRAVEGRANPAVCDSGYGPCRFIGMCPRRGVFGDISNRLTELGSRYFQPAAEDGSEEE